MIDERDPAEPAVAQTDARRDAPIERTVHGHARLRAISRSLPMALLRTREAVMRHFRPALRTVDLTEQQWRVLRALGSVTEIDATSLALATFLLAPSLTRILKTLDERGLIVRRAVPDDLRTCRIRLTPAGRALLDEAGVHAERIYRAITERLGEARLEQLLALLKDVEHDLEPPLDPDEDGSAATRPARRRSARATKA